MSLINLLGVIALCLGLTACAAPTITVDKALPPVDLLQPCEHPTIRVVKNRDLVDAIIAYRAALDLCNNDKAALREWAGDNVPSSATRKE